MQIIIRDFSTTNDERIFSHEDELRRSSKVWLKMKQLFFVGFTKYP